MAEHPLYLAILWHMHQPYYRDMLTGRNPFPWVRLHAVKDYYDMLAILSSYPQIHQTFNLVPSLIEQIEEYTEQNATDDFLELSRKPAKELSLEDKEFLLYHFFLANWEQMIKPYPRYFELLRKRGFNIAKEELKEIQRYFTDQDFLDLQVWFNLAWVDPIHRKTNPEISALFNKGHNFSEEDKLLLLDKHIEIMRKIIPLYQQMQKEGQIELSVSPYYHSLLPLLIDNYIAQVSTPKINLPKERFQYSEHAQMQIQQAIEFYTDRFGVMPQGMWPSEGAVSEAIIPLVAQAGIKWIATDEGILLRSYNQDAKKGVLKPQELYRPYTVGQGEDTLAIVFRDRTLSDLMSFTYMRQDAKKAAADFINRLRNIQQKLATSPRGDYLVVVALDGENAWEQYLNDGHDFLNELYNQLTDNPSIKCVTISEYLATHRPREQLFRLYPGSWIDSNFSIWIGHEEDNYAWDLLSQTRRFLTTIQTGSSVDTEKIKLAWKSIYAAEGSDWFWWYGPPFYTALDYLFDEVYRAHLSNVYKSLLLEIPDVLTIPIKKAYRREYLPSLPAFLSPNINGKVDGYYEWVNAAKYEIGKSGGSNQPTETIIKTLWLGFDRATLFLRLDTQAPFRKDAFKDIKINFCFLKPNPIRAELIFSTAGLEFQFILLKKTDLDEWQQIKKLKKVAYEKVLELAIPFADLGAVAKEEIEFQLVVERRKIQLHRFPTEGVLVISVPPENYEELMWSV